MVLHHCCHRRRRIVCWSHYLRCRRTRTTIPLPHRTCFSRISLVCLRSCERTGPDICAKHTHDYIAPQQYALLIYQVQLPESVLARQPEQSPPSIAIPPLAHPTERQSDLLPGMATARRLSLAFSTVSRSILQLLGSDGQSRFCESSSFLLILYPKRFVGLFLFIFLSFIVRVVLSPPLALSFVAVMYSCFWLPQILRSARRGRSTSLSKEYLFGSTTFRMFFVTCSLSACIFPCGYALTTCADFLACPRNVLDVEPRCKSHVM